MCSGPSMIPTPLGRATTTAVANQEGAKCVKPGNLPHLPGLRSERITHAPGQTGAPLGGMLSDRSDGPYEIKLPFAGHYRLQAEAGQVIAACNVFLVKSPLPSQSQ
jgi:hypothetical protein